jgi:hypothetical protein
MIGRHDSTTDEIYKRLKHIVDDVYRKKGMTSQEIRSYFSYQKNFNRLLKVFGDIKSIYKESKYPIKFETRVHDILFYRILMDRIYYEKDNPQEETLEKYNTFILVKDGQIK